MKNHLDLYVNNYNLKVICQSEALFQIFLNLVFRKIIKSIGIDKENVKLEEPIIPLLAYADDIETDHIFDRKCETYRI